jgi:FtsP/CotA-like multicopper oxidase with cupredoxin domain
MKDMGMGGMDHGAMAGGCSPEHAAMGHRQPGAAAKMDHGTMSHDMRDFANAPGLPRTPVVQTVAPMPVDRTGEPPQGLADVGHRILTYRDLMSAQVSPDTRTPSRALTIHLTGNMERYMWAFDGVKLNAVTAPIPFRLGERVRVTLVNDTMMAHPIHLHGHFFELVTGHGDHAPRKHTVNVAPGGTVTFDLTADAEGDWAFHCHMLYHMHAGMMQVVTVRRDADTGAAA